MPVAYDSPIIEQTSINASQAKGFCVNLRDGIVDIIYEDGNRDAEGVFTAVGEDKHIHLGKAEYDAMVVANPTVYGALKILINNQILLAKNQTGTIV